MNLFSLIALIVVLALIVTLIVRLIVRKSTVPETNIKLGYFHANGNLDFYVTTDNQFVNRIDNHSFPLHTINKITASADEHIIFSKSKAGTTLDSLEIETIFNDYVNHITYQFQFKDGEKYEAVVDVATSKRKNQREELKRSFNKLTTLLNAIEVQD